VQEITGADLSTALSEALTTLFPPMSVLPGTTASWGIFYAYELAADSETEANSLFARSLFRSIRIKSLRVRR